MISIVTNLLYHKFLLYNLVRSEIRSRYKQAALGVAWVIIQPLFLMAIFTIVFSKFARIPSDGIPYPIFSYAALIPWMFFASSLNRGTNGVTANSALIKKIYFPREILPFSYIIASFVDLAVSSSIFALLLFYYKVSISLSILWVIPILFIELIFICGLVLICSALNVFFRDIMHAMPLVIQAWMFLTPVAYPLSLVPESIKPLYMLNPMVAIVDSCRQAVLKGHISDWSGLLSAAIVSIITFVVGYRIFKKFEMRFADVI